MKKILAGLLIIVSLFLTCTTYYVPLEGKEILKMRASDPIRVELIDNTVIEGYYYNYRDSILAIRNEDFYFYNIEFKEIRKISYKAEHSEFWDMVLMTSLWSLGWWFSVHVLHAK